MRKKNIEELNEMLENKGKSIRVLKETDKPNEVVCYCLKCNQTFKRDRKGLFSRYSGCAVCSGNVVVKGFNDFNTAAPHLIKYLDNKEDGFKYSPYSCKEIMVKCPECKTKRKMIVCNLYQRGFSCSCEKMRGHFFVKGINDISTKNKWMVKYFVDKEIAEECTANSQRKVLLKCPDCKYRYKRRIVDLSRHGFSCPRCGDKISFPNKFGRFFITQTNAENIEFEYKREWTNGKVYDIYFEFDGKKYFIEMDGGIHFKGAYGKSLEETKKNDELKDEIAKRNGIGMIRINCAISDADYIENEIRKSKLKELFDLEKIDWNHCKEMMKKSIIVSVCKEYDKNELYAQEMVAKYKLDYKTIRTYIKIGKDIGICKNQNSRKRAAEIRNKRLSAI